MSEGTDLPEDERRVLVCGDEPKIRERVATLLRQDGFAVDTAVDGKDGLDRLRRKGYFLVIAGFLKPDLTGLELLREAKGLRPPVDVVMIGGKADVDDAVEAIRCGAYDYFRKPFDDEDVLLTVRRVVEKRRLQRASAGGYRRIASDAFPRVTVDPQVMGGRPCIRGLPLTVGTVLGFLAAGRTEAEILADHPDLEPADLREALAYTAWVVDGSETPPQRA